MYFLLPFSVLNDGLNNYKMKMRNFEHLGRKVKVATYTFTQQALQVPYLLLVGKRLTFIHLIS